MERAPSGSAHFAPRAAALLRRAVGAVVVVTLAGLGIALTSDPAAAVYGGGCKNTGSIRACISVRSGTTNPVLSDFYLLDTREHISAIDLYMTMNGHVCAGPFHVDNPAAGGPYGPIACTANGSGTAMTTVVALLPGGTTTSANSPTLHFP